MSEVEQLQQMSNVDEKAIEAMFKGTKKKKKKSKKKLESKETEEQVQDGPNTTETTSNSLRREFDDEFASEHGRQSYDKLLARVYHFVHENNPELADRTKKKLKPPQVMRLGTTKSAWVNFAECANAMKRAPDHVVSFFLAELGTTGNLDGKNQLVIKGKFVPKMFESLLRKYIQEYVTCRMCKSLDTKLERDNVTRLYFMSCQSCGSVRSVPPIRTGFHAVGRGERKKARQAAKA